MPNKTRNRLLLAIAAVVCLGVVWIMAQSRGPRLPNRPLSEDEFRGYMNKVREWKIIVDAHIVDDAGNEISGVLCVADKMGPGAWEPGRREESFDSKNPRMHMEFDRVMAVNLRFCRYSFEEKEYLGRYEGFEISLDTKEPLPSAVVDIPNGIQRYNLTVVLNRIPEQKEVVQFERFLEYHSTEKNLIFIMDELGGESSYEGPTGRFLRWSPSTPRPDFAHLYLEVVDAPGVEATYRTDPNWGKQYVITPADKALDLVMHSANPEDGIVLEPGTSEDFQKDRIPWRMTTAPESSYSQRVRIPKEISNDNKIKGEAHRQVFFYFRYGGKYGRGRMTSIDYGITRAEAGFELEYQLDGTRQIR